jgi:hypothetical protein
MLQYICRDYSKKGILEKHNYQSKKAQKARKIKMNYNKQEKSRKAR